MIKNANCSQKSLSSLSGLIKTVIVGVKTYGANKNKSQNLFSVAHPTITKVKAIVYPTPNKLITHVIALGILESVPFG